jgi:undecaprenyl-diphosphatase
MSDLAIGILLGATQGVAEFLPISSSGHLIILSSILNGKSLPLSLNVALHVGTLVAVLLYFFRDWQTITLKTWQFLRWRTRSFESQVLLPALLIGTLPAGLVGMLFKDIIEAVFHHPLLVTIPLALVGILIWRVDETAPSSKTLSDMRWFHGLRIGVFQAFALIPGVSRSGITLLAARQLGFNRMDSARFSFLLGTPAMVGAAALEAPHIAESLTQPIFVGGMLSSAVVGCLTIHFFMRFIGRFGLLSFAIYRIFLAAVCIALYGPF